MPELLQEAATVENLAQAALNLYDDTVTRRRLEALFAAFASIAARRHGRRLPPKPSRTSCALRGSPAEMIVRLLRASMKRDGVRWRARSSPPP